MIEFYRLQYEGLLWKIHDPDGQQALERLKSQAWSTAVKVGLNGVMKDKTQCQSEDVSG